MSMIDDDTDCCNICGKTYHPGEGGGFNWKYDQDGYAVHQDVCLECAEAEGLDWCGECGGLLPKTSLVDAPYPKCPSCLEHTRDHKEQMRNNQTGSVLTVGLRLSESIRSLASRLEKEDNPVDRAIASDLYFLLRQHGA